jgi:hypothetical protein
MRPFNAPPRRSRREEALKYLGVFVLSATLAFAQALRAQTLSLPPRPTDAPSGTAFAQSIATLEPAEREQKIIEQVTNGNVPEFLRKLSPINLEIAHDGKTNSTTYYVTPDYLAVGSDDDYFLTPLSPIAAQKIADALHCSLPTRKMVDEIYSNAAVKLAPSPIPPSPAMGTVPFFIRHNQTVSEQRRNELAAHPLGALVAGHKKDVVISNRLTEKSGRVSIYGWHKLDGKPIQPLTIVHKDTYADYSHGIRLVQLSMLVNDETRSIPEVLADPKLCELLSEEGPMLNPRYPLVAQSTPYIPSAYGSNTFSGSLLATNLPGFQPAAFDEQTILYSIEPDVKVFINAPMKVAPGKKLKLVFFALPNGNTTEQSVGHQLKPGDDWHYDIQHIGAQTRFLRQELKDCSLVVVYLEAEQKSWPVWRKKHADHPELIPQFIDSIKKRFSGFDIRITLSGHSGGGSLIFGYLNAVEQIPDDLERIAFLDSNYAYDAKFGQAKKLLQWLRASDQHYLSVLAYNDAAALLNGTNFVSAAGGTWGRSHAMLADMAELNFSSSTNSDTGLEMYAALNGRVKFLLLENPEKKIFHTVQVERNGFIQSIVSGTPLEGRGYVYFGPRAYTNWIPEVK